MDACTGEVIMSRHLKTRDGHQNRLIGLPSLIIMTLVFILMMDKFLNEMMYKYKLHYTYETLINESNGLDTCLLYTSPSPRDQRGSRMPSSA